MPRPIDCSLTAQVRQETARVLYAFGHGHLGLTQAATTGQLIVERLLGRVTTVDLTPYSIDRFSDQED
jgi:D-amino-acid dehydrogenase